MPELPPGLAGVTRVVEDHGRTTLETRDLQQSLTQLLAWAGGRGVRLAGLNAHSPSLEAVFLAIADGTETTSVPQLEGSNR